MSKNKPRKTERAKWVEAVGKLGDQPPLRTVSGLAIASGLLTANGRLFRAGIRMLLAHEVATLAKDFIKRRVDRTRPRRAKSPSERKVKPGRHTAKEKTSFPSGHSAGAIAVARAFSREYPDALVPAIAAGGAIAAAQVPRRTHYPSDVAAGAALGLLSEAAANLVIAAGDRFAAPQVTDSQSAAPSSPKFK